MTVSSSFAGMDVQLWVAAGAFAGPLLAVLLGLIVFRFQQLQEHAAERFLIGGVQRLHGTLSTLLSIHLQNYQIASYTIRLLRVYDLQHPLKPVPEEIPRFLGLELETLSIDSLLPVEEMLGDKAVVEWAMLAISDVTLEAKEAEFQIRQPVAAYFRSDPSTTTIQGDEAVKRLTAVLEAWNTRLASHFALLDRLNDLSSHVTQKRPWRPNGYYALRERAEVKEIRDSIIQGLAGARKAHKETEQILKSGGETSKPKE